MINIKFNGKLIWAGGVLVLMCVGLGATVFTKMTGIFLLVIGLCLGFMWANRYMRKSVKKTDVAAPLDKMDRK